MSWDLEPPARPHLLEFHQLPGACAGGFERMRVWETSLTRRQSPADLLPVFPGTAGVTGSINTGTRMFLAALFKRAPTT